MFCHTNKHIIIFIGTFAKGKRNPLRVRKKERENREETGGRGTERGKEMLEELGREGEKERERKTAGVCSPVLFSLRL